MNFKPGTVIPVGYAIEIISWENDGDDYRSQFLSGLTMKESEYIQKIMPLFNSKNSRYHGYGNEYYRSGLTAEIIEWTDESQYGMMQKFFGIVIPEGFDKETMDWEDHVDDDAHEAVIDAVYKLIGYPVQYEYNFIRVVEEIKLYYFDEEVKIPVIQEYDKVQIHKWR